MVSAEHFQSHLLALAQARHQGLDRPNWLSTLNHAGQAAFAQAAFPNRKTELWKYTSLFNLSQIEFGHASQHGLTSELTAAASMPEFNSARLVFINGILNAELSDALALKEVTVFSQADAAQEALIAKHLGQIYAQQHNTGHLFNELNNGSVTEGVLVHIGKNQQLDRPIQISYLTTHSDVPFVVNARVLVVLEQGAKATLLEHYNSDTQAQSSLTNALTEIHLGDNAHLQHYHLQTMQEQALYIGAVHTELQRDAQYHAFYLSLGANLSRSDIVVNHNVGGSHSELAGVYVPQHQQLVDYHTTIEHRAAHCTSNEVFRGIMNDKAKAVFNGRIHIHPNAQKTLAELNNKNLLLTSQAEINTKPELEIYADDVKCAHGATVAQLDQHAVFYLQSRGVSQREAEVMLSFGFINELLQSLPDSAVSKYLRPILAQQFGREDDLSQHLTDENLL